MHACSSHLRKERKKGNRPHWSRRVSKQLCKRLMHERRARSALFFSFFFLVISLFPLLDEMRYKTHIDRQIVIFADPVQPASTFFLPPKRLLRWKRK